MYDTPPPMQDSKSINAVSRRTNPMEVAVHVVSEQDWVLQTTDNESGISKDERVYDRQSGSSSDDDLERGAYKRSH